MGKVIHACDCPDVLAVRRAPGLMNYHCLRHGLSWAASAGMDDFTTVRVSGKRVAIL